MSRREAARRHETSASAATKWLERAERDGSRALVGHVAAIAPPSRRRTETFWRSCGPSNRTSLASGLHAIAFRPSEGQMLDTEPMKGRFFRWIKASRSK